MVDIFLLMLFIVLALLVLTIVFTIVIIKRHNVTLHFKEPVNNNFLYHKKKAKLHKDNEGQEFYKTLGKVNGKKYFPIPEDNKSVHLDAKGKKHVHGYISAHGEVVYALDYNTNLFVDETHIKKIQPFTSNQRALYINQERKAIEDAGFNWKQNLPFIIGGLVLVIVIIVATVAFSDMYTNHQTLTETQLKITEKQGEIANVYERLESDIQEIKNEVIDEGVSG